MSVKTQDDVENTRGKFGDSHPTLKVQTDKAGLQMTVNLVLPNSTVVPKGSTVFLSLDGPKLLSKASTSVKVELTKAAEKSDIEIGKQCLAESKRVPKAELCKDPDKKLKVLRRCLKREKAKKKAREEAAKRRAAKRKASGLPASGKVVVAIYTNNPDSWPAPMCGLNGVAELAKKQGEPDLVAFLTMGQSLPCLPMRAMDLWAKEADTGKALSLVLEPQGALRLRLPCNDKREKVNVVLDGIYWVPDQLSAPVSDTPKAVIFPRQSDRELNPQERCTAIQTYNAPERKTLVKDAYVTNRRNGCVCWLQKRLVCVQELVGAGYKCAQYKRAVRIFKSRHEYGRRRKYFGRAKPTDDEQSSCKFDAFQTCKDECANRLLAV